MFGFVKQSGGHIKIYSEVDVGTTVRLYLPRSNSPVVEAPSLAPEPLPHGKETVLVVEDSEKLRRLLVRQLDELGYRVLQAENAQLAIDILKEDKTIDLLFTDIVMPGGMNGWELARAAGQLRADLKVLFTSGFPEATLGSNPAFPQGAIVLSKPYRKNELARRLREALA